MAKLPLNMSSEQLLMASIMAAAPQPSAKVLGKKKKKQPRGCSLRKMRLLKSMATKSCRNVSPSPLAMRSATMDYPKRPVLNCGAATRYMLQEQEQSIIAKTADMGK